MADPTATAPKPSSSVKLVLLGEAAVGKVRRFHSPPSPTSPAMSQAMSTADSQRLASRPSSCDLSTTTFKKTRNQLSVVRRSAQIVERMRPSSLTPVSRLLDSEMQPSTQNHQVRDLGHSRPRALCFACTHVLS